MKVRIDRAVALAPTVKLYTLTALRGDFSFQPGQFFTFLPVLRAYSFCSLPERLPQFEICVRQVPGGQGTKFINSNLGKVVEMSEAQGAFVLPPAAKDILFLASGTGIAPVRPMLKEWFTKYPDAKAILYYKSREGEYLFGKEFDELARNQKNFKVVADSADIPPFISPLQRGRKRGGKKAFVVGSPEFVSGSIKHLEDLGYNKQDINFDIW